jgi:hypothetical protein
VIRFVAYWALVLTTAMAAVVAPLPFKGPFTGAVGVFAAAGIGMTGLAYAPTITRKQGRS